MLINEDVFEKILKMTQSELKEYCCGELKNNGYDNIINEDGFIFAKGDEPILLVAHLDRHKSLKEKVENINKEVDKKGRVKWSSLEGIAGDDRCGVYLIFELIKEYKANVLLCEDEEIGCVGAKKFIETSHINEIKNLNYYIEIDRGQAHRDKITGVHNKHGRDVVFYDISNEEFIKDIEEASGYKKCSGEGSDIKYLSNATGVASFNISSGYYNEHHLDEYIILNELISTYEAVKKVINNVKKKYFAKT